MSVKGCANMKSYRKKYGEEIPIFRAMSGHLRDPDYVAPTKNKWRKYGSDSDRENENVHKQRFIPIGGNSLPCED